MGKTLHLHKRLVLLVVCCALSDALSVSSTFGQRGFVSSSRGRETFPPFFETNTPPFLAVITERHSCDSEEDLSNALVSLKSAVLSGAVHLVSVRINRPDDHDEVHIRAERLRRLVVQLLQWRRKNSLLFSVVVSSDWIEEGLAAGADGVHCKETHRDRIQAARRLRPNTKLLFGTSTHSVASALDAKDVDYFFCGTCYPTASHPEKPIVEGPQLPAQVKAALPTTTTPVLAIGGLDASNAGLQYTESLYEPGSRADGVATIRAVLAAPDPGVAAQTIRTAMLRGSSNEEGDCVD